MPPPFTTTLASAALGNRLVSAPRPFVTTLASAMRPRYGAPRPRLIDLASLGARLNDSSSAAQSVNNTVLANWAAACQSGIIQDLGLTWSGDLYISTTFPTPTVIGNQAGPSVNYFGLIGSGKTRLIYMPSSGWAIDFAVYLNNLENDEHVLVDIQDITIQAPNSSTGGGLRITDYTDGGKDFRIRNVTISQCLGYGAQFNGLSGMQIDSLYTLGNKLDGCTFGTSDGTNDCSTIRLNNLVSRNNGNDGVVIWFGNDFAGDIYAENNGRYGLNATGLGRSNIAMWQEHNRNLATGGTLLSQPVGGLATSGGAQGTILQQGKLRGCYLNVFNGQYGQDDNADFDYDFQSRAMNWFMSDQRLFPDGNINGRTLAQAGWTQVYTGGVKLINWNSNSSAITLVNSGSGASAQTVATINAGQGGTTGGAIKWVRQDGSTDIGSGLSYNVGDLFVIEGNVTCTSGNITYFQSLLAASGNPGTNPGLLLPAFQGSGLAAVAGQPNPEVQAWYFPSAVNNAPSHFRSNIVPATSNNLTPQIYDSPCYPVGNPSQNIVLTFTNLNLWTLPGGWSI